eukprot:10020165-Alexandrium_andersonii.AAC.1
MPPTKTSFDRRWGRDDAASICHFAEVAQFKKRDPLRAMSPLHGRKGAWVGRSASSNQRIVLLG